MTPSPPSNPILVKIARIIAVLFHPGFLPFYFLIEFSSGKSHQLPILVGAFLLLVGLPGLGTWLFLRRKGEKDIYTIERKHRYWLFVFHAIGIGVLWILMNNYLQGYMPSIWIALVFGFNALGFAITLFWKISLHMMGMGAIMGIFACVPYVFPGWVPFAMLIIAPAVAISRWYLKSHDWAQILVGTAVGIVYWHGLIVVLDIPVFTTPYG